MRRVWLTDAVLGSGSGGASRDPEYDRPGRADATDPEADEQFVRQVRDRAEAQRRDYRARRRQELEAEKQLRRPRPDDVSD